MAGTFVSAIILSIKMKKTRAVETRVLNSGTGKLLIAADAVSGLFVAFGRIITGEVFPLYAIFVDNAVKDD